MSNGITGIVELRDARREPLRPQAKASFEIDQRIELKLDINLAVSLGEALLEANKQGIFLNKALYALARQLDKLVPVEEEETEALG